MYWFGQGILFQYQSKSHFLMRYTSHNILECKEVKENDIIIILSLVFMSNTSYIIFSFFLGGGLLLPMYFVSLN